jgi:hypothetical protein
LDNITDNKIIFTKKAKKIIDNNLDNNYGTLTLTANSINSILNNNNNKDKNINNNYEEGLISERSANDSFEKIVNNLNYYKKNKKNEKNKKKEIGKQIKNGINKNKQSGKKLINKVGINYVNKKFNKNIISNLNINNNNTPFHDDNEKIFQNFRNKNSLFALLKSKNATLYAKTENNMNNINNNGKKETISISMNLNNSRNKNNKNSNTSNYNDNNNIYSSPKNNKENFHMLSKLEEFHTNIIRPNTSFHHKRNKTVYFTQNQITGNNIPSHTLNNNYINTLSNILSRNNNTRNYDIFKNSNSNYKQTKFNNYLTINSINNNFINKQRGFNEMKNRMKNKTFEIENLNNNFKVNNTKETLKIYQKNKIKRHSNNLENNNQILIKKNNIVGSTGSKFSLTKNPLKINHNKIHISKNIKSNNLKYFNPKFSPLNCFNNNVMNNKNSGYHKKSQTTILSNILDPSPKNQATSPISAIKNNQNKIYNINQSENITSKIRPKINSSKINNLNINFNNVIFNAPISNINQNINLNNNFINNTNENLSCKLLTPTNQKILHNTLSNNKSNPFANVTTNKEHKKEEINYITNLKNFSNYSRNKLNLYESSLSQNDDYSLIKTNTNSIKGKIIYDKNNRNNNQIYTNLYSNDKIDIFKKKKSEIIIPIPSSKNLTIKKGTKTPNLIKKTKKKIEGRNKKFEQAGKVYGKAGTFKKLNINDDNHESFKTKDDYKNVNTSNNLYRSPNSTGRIFSVQPINVNRNNNLMSKKIIKTKQKIKLK